VRLSWPRDRAKRSRRSRRPSGPTAGPRVRFSWTSPTLIAALPKLDVLFNNAGTNRPKPIAEVSEEDFDFVAGLNLKAAYFVAQAASVKMAEQGTGGVIINVSSQMGHVGAPNRTLYCATKHGLEGLTKALAVELAPNGVRVNSLAPTFIETPMTASFFADPDFRSSVLSKIKLGRLATLADVVGAAVFLASDAAGFVTGTSLLVDGGWTAD
jgi:NAD(P)-dependent dehydrogenase (short-subunit alcohol dehydrogenase family)